METIATPGPTYPTNVYEAMPEVAPQAVVVYCSAPRFQVAFDQFIEKELGLAKGEFIPLVIAGGAACWPTRKGCPRNSSSCGSGSSSFARTTHRSSGSC